MRKYFLIFGIPVIIILFVILAPNQFITKLYLRITGHYITPALETPESILNKLQEDTLYYDRLYRLSELKSFKDFQTKKISTVPFVQIYNKNKAMMSIASGSECKWALLDYFNNKDTINLIAGDSTMYDFIMERLEPIDIRTNQDTFDTYILAGWTNYLPKLSKHLFLQTNDMMRTLKGKVCLSYINMDYQKEWEADMDSLERKSKD